MAEIEKVTYTDESAFHALQLPDANDLQLRADLLRSIASVINDRHLTQVKAGKLMHMDQPRVSALLNGKINLFSTDRLLRALSDLGLDVELRIMPSRYEKGQMRVTS